MVRHAVAAKRAATTEEREVLVTRLAQSAEMANAGEQIQTTAERFSEKMMRALYMKDRIGEEYEAMISDVARFGVFVSIEDPYVEGLIHIRSLGREYFEHDERRQRLVGERSGTTFQLGDVIKVVCSSVDVKEGRINFDPIGVEGRPDRKQSPRGRKTKMPRGKPHGVKPSKKRGRR
jgi:ribonuclease R